jgi:maltose alpha-D-glucosyltransferase/alpha-amylase
VGDLPAQPRRADARDGDRRGARLHVREYAADPRMRINVGIRRRLAPLMENSRADRADERACCSRCPARRSSTTATRSAWATTSTSATATACARRCSGAATATPASRAPTRAALPAADHGPGLRLPGGQRRGAERDPFSLLNWMKRMIALRKQHPVFGRGTLEFLGPRTARCSPTCASYEDDDPVRRQPVAHGAAGHGRR